MKLRKYLRNNLNVVNITKNFKHETNSLTQLKDDNQIVNNLVKNLHIIERFKHIDIAYHHIKNLIKKNVIQLNYIFNNQMMTNEMTKSLSKKRFKIFVRQLNMQK